MSVDSGTLVIDCGKKLDISNVTFFAENLHDITGQETEMYFDLSAIEQIDSVGAQLVYAIYMTAIDHKIPVKWSELSSAADESLSTLGIKKVLFSNKG